MNNSQPPAFSFPSDGNPLRTLVTAKKLAIGFGVFLVVGGAWRVSINQVAADNLKERNLASLERSVITVRSKPGESTRKLVLPASLRGNTETQLYSRTNGYLSVWYKTIGDQVKKGDLLAVIDVPELEQELAQARAALEQVKVRLDLGRSTLKRWTHLKETDSVIQQEYDEKRSAVLQAEADYAAAEVNVKRIEKIEGYRRIIAPFPGVITRRSVDVGSLINAGTQELFALTQTDPLRLTIWIPQIYADEVKVGQEVGVRQQQETGSKVSVAHIEHVAGALDPVTRSRQVDITLPNSDGKILPGSYVEISINLVSNKVTPLVVPANVLVIDQAGVHVVTVDAEKHIQFRPVKLGKDFGREVEIAEGIDLNHVLVASPSDLLVEGETVKTIETQTKPDNKSKEKVPTKS